MGESDDEFFCNKCTESDMNYLNRTLTNDDYRFLDATFARLRLVFKFMPSAKKWLSNLKLFQRNGKHIWPLEYLAIASKIHCRRYRNFRELRDEMFEMIWEKKEIFQMESRQVSSVIEVLFVIDMDYRGYHIRLYHLVVGWHTLECNIWFLVQPHWSVTIGLELNQFNVAV